MFEIQMTHLLRKFNGRILCSVNKAKCACTTYKLANSLLAFNHLITVGLGANLFTLLQFKTHETSLIF